MIPPRKHQMNKGPMPGPGPVSRRRLLWNGFKFNFAGVETFVRHQFARWFAAQRSARRLTHVAGPARPEARAGVALVAAYYGDAHLVAPFVDHHRRLGIAEFVFLDLSPGGDLTRHLAGDRAASVWRPRDSWGEADVVNFLNFLRGRYATGRWCLSLEMSDFFVFYRSESRHIRDFVDFLESESRRQVFAMVVDMYADSPAAAIDLEATRDPVRALPYFDPFGYATSANPSALRDVVVRGGVQRRALYNSDPSRTPALNRMPLAKWGRFCAYIADTRLLAPSRLNIPHSPWHTSPTACLLRFALLSSEAHLASAAKAEDAGLMVDDGGYGYAGLAELRHMALRRDFSRTYESTHDLVDSGLLNPGQWF